MIPLSESESIFDVRDAHVHHRGERGRVHAVRGVSLRIAPGESIGLVGESGCGKSTLARAMLGLNPLSGGELLLEGVSVQEHLSTAATRERFRRAVQMVFQDPFGALNPRIAVGDALREVLLVHAVCTRAEASGEVQSLLESVGLSGIHAARYPHELSGGQRQRVVIARALALGPRVIVADEPVSALDVSVQAQILNLFNDLRRARGLSYLFIAHDLAVVQYVCDRVLVMQDGQIVEQLEATELHRTASHPYTRALLEAVPEIDRELCRRAAAASA